MPIFEAAALAAAIAWAFTGIISADPSRALGAMAFSRWRMTMVFLMLAAWTTLFGGWQTLRPDWSMALALSGFIGIFIGDTALFQTMNRLGPRRTAMLFSLNAPMSVILAWWILGEKLPLPALAGIGIILGGVILAIIYGKRRDQLHRWEDISGPLWIGVSFGLIAALGQAIGALIVRPIMEAGADPVAASAIRVGISALALIAAAIFPFNAERQQTPMNFDLLWRVALSGLLALGIGMTLILFALSGGQVGIVTTLSATTPVMVLPILWWRTKEMPALGAWIGAGLVVTGSALIFNG
ncbi:MAG: DMT family transporter, partial [Pseudomonadota bacterium]